MKTESNILNYGGGGTKKNILSEAQWKKQKSKAYINLKHRLGFRVSSVCDLSYSSNQRINDTRCTTNRYSPSRPASIRPHLALHSLSPKHHHRMYMSFQLADATGLKDIMGDANALRP